MALKLVFIFTFKLLKFKANNLMKRWQKSQRVKLKTEGWKRLLIKIKKGINAIPTLKMVKLQHLRPFWIIR